MKIFIVDYADERLMAKGRSGYFREVELKTGNFRRDMEYRRYTKRLYSSDICLTVKDGVYRIFKAHTKSGYYMDRILSGKNKYTEKQVMRMFGKWIGKKTKFKMTEKSRAHYEKYAEFCPPEISKIL
jgi:hypothetical protein